MVTPVRRPNCGAAMPRPIDRVDLEQRLAGLTARLPASALEVVESAAALTVLKLIPYKVSW